MSNLQASSSSRAQSAAAGAEVGGWSPAGRRLLCPGQPAQEELQGGEDVSGLSDNFSHNFG